MFLSCDRTIVARRQDSIAWPRVTCTPGILLQPMGLPVRKRNVPCYIMLKSTECGVSHICQLVTDAGGPKAVTELIALQLLIETRQRTRKDPTSSGISALAPSPAPIHSAPWPATIAPPRNRSCLQRLDDILPVLHWPDFLHIDKQLHSTAREIHEMCDSSLTDPII